MVILLLSVWLLVCLLGWSNRCGVRYDNCLQVPYVVWHRLTNGLVFGCLCNQSLSHALAYVCDRDHIWKIISKKPLASDGSSSVRYHIFYTYTHTHTKDKCLNIQKLGAYISIFWLDIVVCAYKFYVYEILGMLIFMVFYCYFLVKVYVSFVFQMALIRRWFILEEKGRRASSFFNFVSPLTISIWILKMLFSLFLFIYVLYILHIETWNWFKWKTITLCIDVSGEYACVYDFEIKSKKKNTYDSIWIWKLVIQFSLALV